MKATTVKFDAKTSNLLNELKDRYYVGSKSAVLRKAIALLSVHAEAQNQGARMYVKTKDNQYKLIVI